MISYTDDKTPILIERNISNHRILVDESIINNNKNKECKCDCKNKPVTNEPTVTRVGTNTQRLISK